MKGNRKDFKLEAKLKTGSKEKIMLEKQNSYSIVDFLFQGDRHMHSWTLAGATKSDTAPHKQMFSQLKRVNI